MADASPQIGEASRRAARFLALASLVAVLLCAVAMALSARSYVQRHLDVVALMKTLGATRRVVLAVTLWQLLALALAASVLGAMGGWLTQLWLVRVLRGLLRSDLPPAGPWPLLVGFGVALAMLAGFALPPLLQLLRVAGAARAAAGRRGTPASAVGRRRPGAAGGRRRGVCRPGRLAREPVFIAGLAAHVLVLGVAGAVLMRAAARLRGGAGRPGATVSRISRAAAASASRRSSPSASVPCCCWRWRSCAPTS